jgi:hypothetical protein
VSHHKNKIDWFLFVELHFQKVKVSTFFLNFCEFQNEIF